MIIGVIALASATFGQSVESTTVLTPPDDITFRGTFGCALDGDTSFVGDPERNGFTGGAYLFNRTDTGWRRGAQLVNPDPDQTERFGDRLAVSGDTAVFGGASRLKEHVPASVSVFERSPSGAW